MIMTPNGEAVLMRGDWTPAKLSLGDEVIATPITVTATGEGGVTIPNTYSDSCKLVKVTGKCAQTVTTVGKNLADGAVRFMQIPDYYIWEQQNWIVPESGQTYYIGFSETFAQLNVIAKFADGTTESKAASFGATGKWFTVTDNIVSVQGYTLTFSETVAEIQITAYGQEGNGFGADVVGQLELGTTATTYLPYYTPTTIDLPDLYAVGDMADVMWIDQGQQRAWVERHIDSDILSTSAVVDEQSQAVLATPTIEELEYTALPTYPRHTQLVVSDSDVAPAIEVTALVYREEDS